MSAKVLVVEDEEPLAMLLRYNLEAEGFSVTVASRAEDAEVAVSEDPPDLIVLDWMLPGISGLELCRRLRTGRVGRTVPILMLTARGEETDRIRGLTTGADDYVVKPFSLPELLARVRAILRRTSPSRLQDTLQVGDIVLDVFSRTQLLDGVWGRDVFVDERTVDVHIGRLRKALNRGREQDPIRTVRGAGYAFGEKIAQSPETSA